jgi:hypothetical protein
MDMTNRSLEVTSYKQEQEETSNLWILTIISFSSQSQLQACTFSTFWLPLNWPLSNVVTWSQVIESVLTPIAYWLAQGRSSSKRVKGSSARYQQHHHNHSRFPISNGSLCFNNGEFQYFAGGKNSSDGKDNDSNEKDYDYDYGISPQNHVSLSYHYPFL